MSLIIVILFGLLIVYISRLNLRKIYLTLKIPGPFPLPFIGNGLYYLNKTPAEIWRKSCQLCHDYGDIVRIWVGSECGAIISNPEYLEQILTSSKFIEKSETYILIRKWLNDGLLVSSGTKWFQRRKLLTPAFHFKVLEEYTKIFCRQSSVFVDVLSKYKPTDKIELLPLLGLCTLDVICEAAMGVNLQAQLNENSEYVEAVNKMNHVIHLRVFGCFYRSDFIFRFTKLYQEEKRALQILHGFTDSVIRERREKLVANTDGNTDEGIEKNKTFLDILLRGTIDGKPLSDLDIREECDTFMFEGHDTTKSALTFCFFSIARYPEVQRKCFREIREILGDNCSTPASFNDLNNLKYLELVIKETLRLYPSVPVMGRMVTEETVIGGYRFPKGAGVGWSPVVLGRLPKLFPNPLEFRPERFLEDITTEKFVFSYLPFSAGPRNCIGQKFALLEMKALLSKVLRHYEISLAEESNKEPELIGEQITTTAEKLYFHLKPRSY